ncbi:MAG: carbohydrate binding domain-containing protein [Verrucomicrobia bacterium]|nr:carbohydrate binding domain-containing protein [Verrucomicrobiota bacterium]
MMKLLQLAICALGWLGTGAVLHAQPTPFVLPWNDASPGVTDLAGRNRPIDSQRVTVDASGHFRANGERVRFLGVNFAGDSPFMPTNNADAVAARLAKFGVNNARFHHLDAPWASGGGILRYTSTRSRDFNRAQLERLHFLIARLKAHGIYANLNLLVGREYRSDDGLGPEITTMDWKDQHIVGFFNDAALALQQEYATGLLKPVNPFTGWSLAQDPAVAFVEIINENGVLQKWFDLGLDRLPARYAADLQARWNDWLAARYADDAALLAAWQAVDQPLGPNLLRNGAFTNSLTSWTQERHDTAQATFERTFDFTGGEPSARITVTTPGSANWHVQFNQTNLRVVAGRVYTLTFSAKALAGTPLNVSVMQAHDPWQTLGFSRTYTLDADWRRFTNTLVITSNDTNARVNFGGFGDRLTSVWLADVRFQEGGRLGTLPEGASVAAGTIPNVQRSGDGFTGTVEVREDWLRFLRDLEHRYYELMVGHVREACGYSGLVFGTIMANSPATVQNRLDVIDAHSYWQHPVFPNQPWDAVDWYLPNVSLVNTLGDGNTLAGLARQRIQGRPFTVTEYQHPSPNEFGAEGTLLLAAYAALQDWDGLWLFDYGPGNDSVTMGRIRGFFDIAQHPAKMANLAIAAHLFRRGDVAPALQEYTMALRPDAEIDLLHDRAGAWNVFSGSQLGLPPRLPLVSRVNVDVGPDAVGLPTPPSDPTGNIITADTGELTWNLATAGKGFVTVNTARTKALIGFTDQREVDLGGVRFQPGTTQLGFSTLALTLVRGSSFTQGGTALLVASGRCENSNMIWKDASHTSVGNQWGNAPTLIETVPFTLTLPVAASRLAAWSLDERGQRKSPLSVTGDTTHAVLNVDGSAATLWYELEIAGGFASWQSEHFSAAELLDPWVSGPLAAPAGDGVANLAKYAFALPPHSPAPTAALPRAYPLAFAGETYLGFEYRSRASAPDLTYQTQRSTDLLEWANAASDFVEFSATGTDPRTLVLRSRQPLASASPLFLRLWLELSAGGR